MDSTYRVTRFSPAIHYSSGCSPRHDYSNFEVGTILYEDSDTV